MLKLLRFHFDIMALQTPAGVKNKDAPKFAWDHDVPETPFWSDLKFTTGRNFLQSYSQQELDGMAADFARLDAAPKDDKLRFLLAALNASLAARNVDVLVRDDYRLWARLMVARVSCLAELGLVAEQEAAVKAMIDHPQEPGGTNYSALNMMGSLKEERGEYAEAERLARHVLPWLETLPGLEGRDSPPALGTRRCIIRCLWKQGKRGEAEKFADETREIIEGMGEKQSKFPKYQDDERHYLAEQLDELAQWDQKQDT